MTMEKVYGMVEGIVERVGQEYLFWGWSAKDWEQEGYLFMYNLILKRPYLLHRPWEFCEEYERTFREYVERYEEKVI